MAEFRKREDITQEIDLLQQWSDLGAPAMGELTPNLRSLVKSVDPSLVSEVDIRTSVAPPPPPGKSPVPSEVPPKLREAPKGPPQTAEEMLRAPGWPPEGPPPPEFANLPPGDEERPSRRLGMGLAAGALVLAAALAFAWSKDPLGLLGPAPASPTPDGEHGQDGAGSPGPEATVRPAPATASMPAVATQAPATAAPTAEASATVASARPPAPGAVVTRAPRPEVSGMHTPGSAGAHGASTAGRPRLKPQLPGLRPPRPIVQAYVVQRGDSLSAIAERKLGDMHRWPEIQEANSADISDPDLIHPGLKLRIPAAEAAPPAAPAAEAPRSYTARPGDTLRKVAAAQLGDAERWREIWELNRAVLPAQTVIPPGTVIRLPAGGGEAAPAADARRPAARRTIQHVVQPGESLGLLARRYLGSAARWPEIYHLNQHKLANPHWVYPGQVLAIPGAGRPLRYVVRSGDTLWAIAGRSFGNPLGWPRVYAANRDRIADPHWIYPGQIFRLPR